MAPLMPTLQGKVTIVTGGGRGIGRATAEALVQEGADLAIIARTTHELNETARLIESLGRRALTQSGDVRKSSDIEQLIQRSLELFGRIDILVNNAGVAIYKPFAGTTEEEWRQTIEVNLYGVFLATKAVLPSMKRQGGGVIVNVSSGAGKYGFPFLTAYCASKFGLNGFTEALAREVAGDGIRVYAVCPGGVDTKMHHDIFPAVDPRSLLQPEQVAHVIVDLATGRRRASSGTAVDVG